MIGKGNLNVADVSKLYTSAFISQWNKPQWNSIQCNLKWEWEMWLHDLSKISQPNTDYGWKKWRRNVKNKDITEYISSMWLWQIASCLSLTLKYTDEYMDPWVSECTANQPTKIFFEWEITPLNSKQPLCAGQLSTKGQSHLWPGQSPGWTEHIQDDLPKQQLQF